MTGQLQLLPASAPALRAASIALDQLTGYHHAQPSCHMVALIAALGVLQPILVVSEDARCYEIVEGRRRAKAVHMLATDGRWPQPPHIDALILTDTGRRREIHCGLTLALHAARGSSPASELAAIEAILAANANHPQTATIAQIAAQTRLPLQTVKRRMRLRRLSPALRHAFDHGHITISVAEAAARLSPELQTTLERQLRAGAPVTLGTVRELTRDQMRTATAALPNSLFANHPRDWRLTVHGHLTAALNAVPDSDRDSPIARALADAITRAEQR